MNTKPRRRRRWPWITAVVTVLTLTAGLALVFMFPSIAATACPRCYGLVQVQDELYAERDVSDADRQRLAVLYRDANQRVTDFYEGRNSKPIVLACLTPECYSRIGGGGERGVAVRNRAVMLSPRGIDLVILAHELSHVEFHARLDPQGDQVPQWFDEGLAVLVADDTRYLLPRATLDRCRDTTKQSLPRALSEWLSAASADEQMYAKAACQVHRWVEAHGGRRAVLDLIDRLNHGERFAELVDG